MEIKVAVGLVFKDGAVLINQRITGQDLQGFWEFPGGKVKPAETYEAALKREFFEEFNLLIESRKLIFKRNFDYLSHRVLLNFYWCEALNLEALVAREGHNWCWCELRDLAKYEFLPANEELIQLLINNELL